MADLTIREILDLVPRGQIRIPAFQRGFVWDPEMVAFLMDSIFKGYPFGSILLWRTREQLRFERQLGPFALPERDPDYPIDYVLDGQQRITSIFGVFQGEIVPDPTVDWADIYFDLAADINAQETQFAALAPNQIDLRRHFPLKTLFQPIEYRRATEPFGNPDIVRIDEMQARFKESRIPYQLLTTEDRARVAIVFERISTSSESSTIFGKSSPLSGSPASATIRTYFFDAVQPCSLAMHPRGDLSRCAVRTCVLVSVKS